MNDALARSIAETAADALGHQALSAGITVSDEAIGLHLWHERGFRDHDTLVILINHTRRIIDTQKATEERPGAGTFRRSNTTAPLKDGLCRHPLKTAPVQLTLDLDVA